MKPDPARRMIRLRPRKSPVTEDIESTTLVMLRRLDMKLDRVIDGIADLKLHTTSVEQGITGVNRRLDRMESCLGRIEHRLDLAEA